MLEIDRSNTREVALKMQVIKELTEDGEWLIKFDFRMKLGGERYSTLRGFCDESYVDVVVKALEELEEED